MSFRLGKGAAPREFVTDEVRVRPLRVADVDLDYDAVMVSQPELALTTGGRWPRPEFSREENRRDLEVHEREHDRGEDFAYTILNPDESVCLGCVYLHSTTRLLQRIGLDRSAVPDAGANDAWVRFWIRSDRLTDGLEERFVPVLVGWLEEEWRHGRVLYTAHVSVGRQVRLYEGLGVRRVYVLGETVVLQGSSR